ncbi:MAG: hypothetical protein IMX01_09355 [Limnochordaceae bacterium]|nr:hypothetical protein [Limnochordaceae bacterium]
MTQVRVDGSPVAQFFYDAYGRRVKIVEGDTTTLTLYSGHDIVYEVKTQPGKALVTTKYLAVGGKYLAKVVQEGTSQRQTYFYHTDLVGSVRTITNSRGQVVARFEYEPFGVTTSASGPLASSPQAGGETHKFTGKPEDAAIDLYYFNARYYDPLVGRFIQQDPARSGLNWYLYGEGNPLRYRDPTGLVSEGEASALVVSLGPYIVYWADHYDISVALLSGVLYDELTRTSRIYGLAEIPAAFFGMETSVGIASMKPTTAKILEDKGLVPAAGSNWERVWRLSDPKSAVRYAAANLRSIADELATKGDPRLVTDEMIATNYSLSRVEPVTYRRGMEAIVSGRKLIKSREPLFTSDFWDADALEIAGI